MTASEHMTNTAAAPLEQRLRDLAAHLRGLDSGSGEAKLLSDSAEALAKARVALEAVFVRHESDDELGARTWLECPICRQGPNCSHPYTCPIGAALEAMK